VAQFILNKAEGNPFFLEELARTVREQSGLSSEVKVPDTVQEVLLARINRLAERERRLLQSAAVIGKSVSLDVLRAIADLSDLSLSELLACLQTADFLYEASSGPEVRYSFKHALTHEVAYGSLLPEHRRVLHSKIVEVIERLHSDRVGEHIEPLAHHALRAQLWGKAVIYLRQAGIKIFKRWAYREAAAHFKNALHALKHLPEDRDRIEQEIDLRLDLRNALIPLGDVESILGDLREAETLARSINDRQRLGWISAYSSACFWVMGDYAPALEAAQQTRTIGLDLGDASLQVYANSALGWTYHSLGEYRHGIECASQVVEFLQGDLIWQQFGIPSLPAVGARTWLALCLAERGEFAQAIVRGEEAVQLAEAIQNPWSLVSGYFGLGVAYLRKGAFAEAIPLLERGLDVCHRFGIRVWSSPLASSLGYSYALSGRASEAIEALTRAVAEATSTRSHFYYSLAIAWLSEAYLLAERRNDAMRLAGEALDLSREHHELGHQAYAFRLLGEIAAREAASDITQAEDHYRQALALASQLEMRPLVAQCHFSLGRLNSRVEKWREAHENVARALTLFRDMEMESWSEQSRDALREIDSMI
jgi:tetratricopeptide (TPR) repeat protein